MPPNCRVATKNQLIIASSDNKIKTGYAILDDLSTEGASGIPTSDAVKNAISTIESRSGFSSNLHNPFVIVEIPKEGYFASNLIYYPLNSIPLFMYFILEIKHIY